jgi:NRAMP (natural resistance-associated macrophage protein)-like metal ion transporter
MKNLLKEIGKEFIDTGKKYTVKEIEKEFNLSAKKTYFLVRNDLLIPLVQNGKLIIPEKEIKRYLSLPKEERDKHHKNFINTLGPGIITGASDDDPSGIGTYSMVGAKYGLSLTWLALYLLPMMTAVQETCARIGIVTGKGLVGAIKRKYSKKILFCLILLLLIANTVNIGADIGAMVAGAQLLIPINFALGAIILTLFMLLLEIFFKYHRYAKLLKWLTISVFSYILVGFIIRPDWGAVISSIAVPEITFSKEYIAALVAVMGTTISPYLFFWQTSEEVEEKIDNKTLSDHHIAAISGEISDMRKDTLVGMSYANLVFLFIVISTAFVLHQNGIFNIETADQAASALKPLAGDWAALLFTVGIFGVGLLAVPVLAGSSAYAVAELFSWSEGLSKKYSKAKGFYGVIILSLLIGLLINFIGISPMKALYYAAIVNGIAAPILLYFIFKVGNDKEIMGRFTNPAWVKFFGLIATLLMGLAAVVLVILALLG